MKKVLLLFISLFMYAITLSQPVCAEELTILAEKLVDAMEKKDFASPMKSFDHAMQKALPPEKLKDAWSAVTEKMGRLKLRGTDRIQKINNYDVVFVKCQFEKGALETKVVFNDQKYISGLFFLPPRMSGASNPPSYANPDRFREYAAEIGTGPWKLSGTLALPVGSGSFPALILIHGSGPNDRDETVGPNKPFRDIAQGLATRGIAVLRFDKRTLTWKKEVIEQSVGFTVKEEVVDDVLAAYRFLQKTRGIDPKRIYILGHSLGGMLIPRIHEAGAGAAGYIILAGSTRPLEELIIEQTSYLASLQGPPSEDSRKELADLMAKADQIRNLKPSEKNATGPWIIGALPGYWLDLREYFPAQKIGTVKKPLLILQGERDYQVTMRDFDNWKKALPSRPDVKFISYPLLNHLFMKGEGKSTPDEYQKMGNVAEGVIKDIADFIFPSPK